ncbi:MAG: hypothetical protein A2V77_16545 [Anaeromyxobacter sp. RBG_16_69_14]|nr:MAG: hypothetical protein A2V77_16545 [Anaeromyxobacter sp. RBG_16_69_14]
MAHGDPPERDIIQLREGPSTCIARSDGETILSNNGYEVYGLGKQVPVATILEKAIEVNADAIGLCARMMALPGWRDP